MTPMAAYKPNDRVWYFTAYTTPTSKRIIIKGADGKGHYAYKSVPSAGGYWSPGGRVLEVLSSSVKVEVPGEWDKTRHRFTPKEVVLPFNQVKP